MTSAKARFVDFGFSFVSKLFAINSIDSTLAITKKYCVYFHLLGLKFSLFRLFIIPPPSHSLSKAPFLDLVSGSLFLSTLITFKLRVLFCFLFSLLFFFYSSWSFSYTQRLILDFILFCFRLLVFLFIVFSDDTHTHHKERLTTGVQCALSYVKPKQNKSTHSIFDTTDAFVKKTNKQKNTGTEYSHLKTIRNDLNILLKKNPVRPHRGCLSCFKKPAEWQLLNFQRKRKRYCTSHFPRCNQYLHSLFFDAVDAAWRKKQLISYFPRRQAFRGADSLPISKCKNTFATPNRLKCPLKEMIRLACRQVRLFSSLFREIQVEESD